MNRNSMFSQIVGRVLEKLNLVSLCNHHEVSHTFEQFCRNGRVSQSTVDHFVLSPRLLPLFVDCGVIHRGDNLSVHSPIWVKVQVGALPLKKQVSASSQKKPSWSRATEEQVDAYTAELQGKLQAVHVPPSLHCQDVLYKNAAHSEERDSLVLDILCAVVETSYTTLTQYGGKGGGRPNSAQGTPFPGWVEEVGPYQKESNYWHDAWVL